MLVKIVSRLILIILLFSKVYAQEIISYPFSQNGKTTMIMKEIIGNKSYKLSESYCKNIGGRVCNTKELKYNCSKVYFVKIFNNSYEWVYDNNLKKPLKSFCLKNNFSTFPTDLLEPHFFRCCKDLN